MSDIITTTGRSVGTITAEIVAISNQAAQMAYMSMIEIGRRLVEVKEQIPHGEWGDYLKNEVKFSHSSANNFMRIFRRSSEANSQTFANLGYSHIVKLLALPDEELSEFAESHDLQSMSARQLEQAIKDRDNALRLRAAAEEKVIAAQAATRDAEQRLLEQQQIAAAAKSSEAAWQLEANTLQHSLDQSKKQAKELKANPKLSDEQREKLVAEAKAEAAEAARAEVQEQLDKALAEARSASEACAAAEKLAQELQAQAAADKKAEKMSDPDVIRFNDLGKQILDDLNRLDGYRLRIVAHNPEMDAKLKAYLAKMAAIVNKRYGSAAASNISEVKSNEQG